MRIEPERGYYYLPTTYLLPTHYLPTTYLLLAYCLLATYRLPTYYILPPTYFILYLSIYNYNLEALATYMT